MDASHAPIAVSCWLLGLILAPLLLGVINRTKALFAGRTGPPLLQPYFDLRKLLGKGAVYSRTTTWVFRAGPIVGLAVGLVTMALLPFGGNPALLAFSGDLVLFGYLLALGRFFTVVAALDTSSAFEGMGASREVQFSALAEPALFLGLAVLVRLTGSFSLSGVLDGVTLSLWTSAGAELGMVAGALLVVVVTENARVPMDDPNTHLELTMIHEAMVLDHCGVDLAFIQYGAALKLWVLGGLLVGLVLPLRSGIPWLDVALFVGGQLLFAVVIGVAESTQARLRLVRIPPILIGADALAALALLLSLR